MAPQNIPDLLAEAGYAPASDSSKLGNYATGETRLRLAPKQAVVLTLCPADAPVGPRGQQLLVGGRVVDFHLAALDADADGLPDWWESRYYASVTAARPEDLGANGRTLVECYQLGLRPHDPAAQFAIRTPEPDRDGAVQLTWSTVGGKRYALEAASQLAAGTAFEALTFVEEGDVVIGEVSAESYTDRPGQALDPRFYRVRLVDGP